MTAAADWRAHRADQAAFAARFPQAHDTYTHAEDGRVCIPLDDEWFVPLDAGGEGFGCERHHGPAAVRRQVAEEIAAAISARRHGTPPSWRHGLDEALRIAREVGGRC